MSTVVRAHERDDDAVLVAALALVRGEHLDARARVQDALQQLHLLAVQRDDADLRLLNAAPHERLRELAHELRLHCILHEITHARLRRGKEIRVYEDGLATGDTLKSVLEIVIRTRLYAPLRCQSLQPTRLRARTRVTLPCAG